MVQSILYATDFSETAENAFSHALTLAVLFGARLTLLHVRVPLEDDPNNPKFHFPELPDVYSRAETIAEEVLREKAPRVEGIDVQEMVRRGIDADSEILRVASEIGADLIVMGTHGRRGLDQWMLGSVTDAVVKRAEIPVFTVRKDVVAPDPEYPYRRILVPVDLSSGSSKALKAAVELSANPESRITVLHVEDGKEDSTRFSLDSLTSSSIDSSRVQTRDRKSVV